jgi:prepilin-type N-terminal cleavage/methylation domain-containing protein
MTYYKREREYSSYGFTLIELSIVLVIIGLVVGGVLVGRDLIAAAAERAQISQIESFNSAVNTFYGKYGYLPGDIPAAPAHQFGFAARGTNPGQGDGNGVIQSWFANSYIIGMHVAIGENGMFWNDLTYANGQNINLIPGSFTFSYSNLLSGPGTTITGTAIGKFLPAAAIGQGNYVSVWSGGIITAMGSQAQSTTNGINRFGVEAVTQINTDGDTGTAIGSVVNSAMGLTVKQAYDIDKKIDDGIPQSGRVLAYYASTDDPGTYGAGTGSGNYGTGTIGTGATAGSTTTCYDNSAAGSSGTPGVGGTAQHYSLEINNGNGVNCALSFQFQGGD